MFCAIGLILGHHVVLPQRYLEIQESSPVVTNGCGSGSRLHILILVAPKKEKGSFFLPEVTKKCLLVFPWL